MQRAIETCNDVWHFQSYTRFDVSLDRGILSFTAGPRPPIDCDIQVVGTFLTTRNMSWDNPSIELALRGALDDVRRYGEENKIDELTTGAWKAADEEAAWTMTAIAAKLVGAESLDRAPSEALHLFLLVTGVRPA